MSGFGRSGGGFGRSRGDDYEYNGAGAGENVETIFVPAGECGKIIGRGGSKIRELQEDSGCKIKVMRDDEGDGKRRVELSGSSTAIDRAREMINATLDEDRGPPRQQQSYGGGGGGDNFSGGAGGGHKEVMQVDSSFVGRIIGKGGSRVREMQDETGCRINVSRDGGSYGQTDVELIGSRTQVHNARQLIEDITSQQAY